MLFTAKRVRLRKMTTDDTSLYHEWRNDLDVMQATNPSLDVYSYAETKAFVEGIVSGSSGKSYIIMERDNDQPIGVTALTQIDAKNRSAECIIDIGKQNFWGKGYGAEAMQLLLDYAFLEMNLHRVSLRVFSFNERAIRLYEKLGFQHEGKAREALFRNGRWHDIVYMGMLQGEFEQAKHR
ncbi:GNAT family N-acetyltransferase [Bacillaceae bacterium SIJ1]|uniref:GNAT family N-acetyltransferase n=1 Tax=Litoribacterium kuwaitense TaxID=1398745 RepID=UPI0013EC2B33|nr:GNAT family protein [Litoribacterium kuwaitense]NGP46228.1 GNAT family N-acetyltransferase [Litoribacterium kuwaitense]